MFALIYDQELLENRWLWQIFKHKSIQIEMQWRIYVTIYHLYYLSLSQWVSVFYIIIKSQNDPIRLTWRPFFVQGNNARPYNKLNYCRTSGQKYCLLHSRVHAKAHISPVRHSRGGLPSEPIPPCLPDKRILHSTLRTTTIKPSILMKRTRISDWHFCELNKFTDC